MKFYKTVIALLILTGIMGILYFKRSEIIKKIKYYKLSHIKFESNNIVSNLPLVIIQTHKKIPDEPKIIAELRIISNSNSVNTPHDQGNIFNGKIGIELRGKSSQEWPQKSFGFETLDVKGKKTSVSLFDMPEENDWILLATFNDRQFMENSLSYHLFAMMGHYAPRSRLCEVIINNNYEGIYLLTEKIKIDKGRVNISKMKTTHNSGDSLTGGYIFLSDYYTEENSWESNYKALDRPKESVHFVYHTPKPEKLTIAQKNYLKNYINRFEKSLFENNRNYKAYIDVPSFLDYFIISELSHNRDAYKKSCYFYKDRNSIDSLIYAGPVWDFDYAWLSDPTGWVHEINKNNGYPVAPSWINKLLQDTSFRSDLFERYTYLRNNVLSKDYLNHYIDSVHLLVENAQIRHYKRWPTLEYNIKNNDDERRAFDAMIMQFKEEIWLRIDWLDQNIPGKELQQ